MREVDLPMQIKKNLHALRKHVTTTQQTCTSSTQWYEILVENGRERWRLGSKVMVDFNLLKLKHNFLKGQSVSQSGEGN